jgi:CAP-Gly domain
MGDLPLELGQTVLSKDGRQGVIRYIGNAAFATGAWLGLELPDDKGKNDGSINGERYFECQPGFGIFVRPESITEILKRPPVTANGKPISKVISRATAKPRPSNGIGGDTARKRQSLAGTGSHPGSRLSLHVRYEGETIHLFQFVTDLSSLLPSRPPNLWRLLQTRQLRHLVRPLLQQQLREPLIPASNLDSAQAVTLQWARQQ